MCHVSENLVDDLPSVPDGEPHGKACPVCAFLPGNPQGLCDDDRAYLHGQLVMGGFEFLCVHRPDAEGRFRTCACWAAKVRGQEARRAATAGNRRPRSG